MVYVRIAAGVAALVTLSACQAAPSVSVQATQPVAAADTRAVTLTFAPPKTYGVQSGTNPVHRWVAADVYQYDVKVQLGAGTSWTDVRTLVVAKGQTSLLISDLVGTSTYRALVTAKGNQGGTAATTVLNATPLTVSLAGSATIRVTLDDVPFAGEADITVTTPAAGVYNQPSPGPTGAPQ
jgi:hypothetical protein